MFVTQRISGRQDTHKKITPGRESAEVGARDSRYKRRSEDLKD